jgi:signal transduction histidine kinase
VAARYLAQPDSFEALFFTRNQNVLAIRFAPMAFKIAARTILHLGGELISSDAVALYELIKNAFDAGSKAGVTIEVFVNLPSWPGIWPSRLLELEKIPKSDRSLSDKVISLKNDLVANLDQTAASAVDYAQQIRTATSLDQLKRIAEQANQIVISDTGHGMSKSDLTEIYLTIGTRYRREEKENLVQSGRGQERPILGEKGIGRLSVMRLGQQVRVKTTRSGETNWNILEIDWSRFSHDSDELLEEIDVEPKTGEAKTHRSDQGTTIIVSALNSRWTKSNLLGFAGNEAAKFNSPFDDEKRYKVILRFNGEIIPIRDFDEMILNNCHAQVSATFTIEKGEPHLRGRVDYRQHKREQSFHLTTPQLLSVVGGAATANDLIALGPFSMEVFWFNRRLLQKKEDGGVSISDFIRAWAGGLLLYRDGFRVLPYGDPDDDWLDLDKKALASAGYKVNRQQLIGHVDISSIQNPALNDQTNREGLRESPEKNALVSMLKHILEVELRRFLNEVDGEERARLRLSFDELEERLTKEKTSLRKNLAELRKHRSETPHEQLLFKGIDEAVASLEQMMEDAKALADEFERGRSQMLHLAGLGLMVEFLAHELNRATQHALGTLVESKGTNRPLSSQALQNLELQLKTLQKRLSTLDPATTSGRNRKERFDIALLAQQTIDGHQAEFKRHGIIAPEVLVLPRAKPVEVSMVKGMVVQVLENLLSNSVYWLKQEQRVRRNFIPRIEIVVDTDLHELRVTDNGPGISSADTEHIFKPFFTRKPPGEGKGLGLYISREIAHYHKAELFLSEEHHGHSKNRNTFVLAFPK